MENEYNIHDLHDLESPKGKDFKYLVGLLEEMLKEVKGMHDEFVNFNAPHPLMTKQDVADYFQVSVRTVENMVRDGELNPVMVKSLPRFKRADVDRCAQRASTNFFKPD